MKDLDFEELDRAVNSLIAKDSTNMTAGNSASGVAYVEPISVDNELLLDGESQPSELVKDDDTVATVIPTPISVPEPIATPTPISAPYIEKPSTGRFMDVVHPSSNMRASLIMPERSSVRSTVSSMPVSRAPLLSSITALHIKPDLAPVATVAQTVVKNNIDDDEDEDINRISNDINSAINSVPEDSLVSPFLSGTKVEKRPLGAFSDGAMNDGGTNDHANTSAVTNDATFANTASLEKSTNQSKFSYDPELALSTEKDKHITDEVSDELDAPLPAELQSELLSIESDEAMVQPEKEPDSTPSTPPAVLRNEPVAPVAIAAAPIVTSIQPQYKEKPSTGDQNNGAIYDVKNYHKSVSQPSGGKSGWMWIIWIVILLIVGVGVGAAVYFLVLPQL